MVIDRSSKKAFDKMAKAVAAYVKSMGGSAVVVGPIGMGRDSDELRFNYYLKVHITGVQPTKKLP